MIQKIIEWSAKNRSIIYLSTLLVIVWSFYAIRKTPMDALPDLSDTQVIIMTEWKGQSPNIIEDQITYPIVSAFLSAPKVKVVRGFTMFGFSFIYVLFEEGTDMYWARSRTLEYLSPLQAQMPEGVAPAIGPDATGVGWVFEYALIDESGTQDLQQLRSFQDWYLRYWLAAVPGVAEIASIGGYQKEYQVEIDPVKLQSYGLSMNQIRKGLQESNLYIGARVIEMAQHEYAVRGSGYITDTKMIEQVVVGTDQMGSPVTIDDIANVQIGGNIRRGLTELDGKGEVVGGIVVMRFGENPLKVIKGIKDKIKDVEKAFPPGVKLVTTYDRSKLIKNSMFTLFEALGEEILLIFIVILIFLFHFRSSLVPIITLPIAVLLAFIPMYYMGLSANIMSLAGIIIAIGDVVDSALIMTENAHQKLEENKENRSRQEVIIESAKEIGPSIFASLLIIVLAFIPVFSLQAQEGKLFSPLAFTKTFSTAFGCLLGITLVPALMVTFIKGKIRPMLSNPITKGLIAGYRPLLKFSLKYRKTIIFSCLALILSAVPFYLRLGSEFMPPLDEEDIFFMPITTPGISIEAARELVQKQDKIIYSFPEVKRVFGKVGRADTSTDPAPLSMIETMIVLHPKSKWRKGMTKKKLIEEMNTELNFKGVQNAWTMPIKARLDMLTTGIRTPVGIKVIGDDLEKINNIGIQIEKILKDLPGTRSVYAERETGGFYIDYLPNREALARYGLTITDVMDFIESAIGGKDVTKTIEGRERYTINIRYPRGLRSDPLALEQALVPINKAMAMMEGTNQLQKYAHVPLGQLGQIKVTMGPSMIKDEMGYLSGWVYVDLDTSDLGGYVDQAKKILASELKLPESYFLKWTGQYEYLERIQKLLTYMVPLTIFLILIVLYINFKAIVPTLIVMLSVPFAAIGAIYFLFFANYNTSVAVWVGMIALLGIAAETIAIMVVYLEQGYKKWLKEGKIKSPEDIPTMALSQASLRIRPFIMAIGLNIIGLVPIMISEGVGSDIARRIAMPLWGGLVSLTLLTLFVIPAIYVAWKMHAFKSENKQMNKQAEQ
ncbi:MAG: CusA/CzcA family heavy metal efflux RND transporter [Simkaniaceae bacterium]|nr:CusA/CzcA family heavy metal efflux RND transporter [Candidatus Sacchlamyda saccharinae]